MRSPVLPVSLLAIVLGMLWLPPRFAVQSAPAASRPSPAAIVASGSVALPRQARLAFGATGTVGDIWVRPGDRVRAGQELARLENAASLEEALRWAELAFQRKRDEAAAAVRNAEINLENARRNLIATQNSDAVKRTVRDLVNQRNFLDVRYGELVAAYEAGQVGKDQVDKLLSDLLTARERVVAAEQNAAIALSTAENNVAKAEEALRAAQEQWERLNAGVDPDLERAREALRNALIIAPFAGIVEEVLATPGMRVSGPVIVIVDPSVTLVTAEVEETRVAAVQPGQKARVTIAAAAQAQFEGTVQHVAYTGKTQAGAVLYPVTIALPTPRGLTLRSGMTSLVEILVEDS